MANFTLLDKTLQGFQNLGYIVLPSFVVFVFITEFTKKVGAALGLVQLVEVNIIGLKPF